MTQRQYRRRFNKNRGFQLMMAAIFKRVWRKIELNSRYGKLSSPWKFEPGVPFSWERYGGGVMRVSHEEMFKQPSHLYPAILLAHSKIDPS